MPVVNINGVDMYYEADGRGNAILFMHGMTGSVYDWTHQFAALAPRYKVIARDLRGHSKSAAPPREEDYSIPVFAEDVYGLLRHLNISKACIAGHSIGGFIALEFALAHPEMLAALVLVDTSSGEWDPVPGIAELRPMLDELARTQGMEAAYEFDAANNPQRIERFQKHPEQREITRRKMWMTSVDGYVYCNKAIAKWQPVTARLSEIKVPTLIFWGDEDTPFIKASQVLKGGIANSQLVTVNGVGHNPHEEAPAIFNEALLKFLDSVKW